MAPPSLGNMTVNYTTTTYLSTAVYTCQDNMLFNTTADVSIEVSCLASGLWEAVTVSCIGESRTA